MAEQTRIEAQLLELEGMKDIQVGLEHTYINEDEQMRVDQAPGPPRPIEAKRRALEKFVRVGVSPPSFPPPILMSSFIRSTLFPTRLMIRFYFKKLISPFLFSGQRLAPTKWRQGTSVIT
jgi:hypothetical protein